MNDPSTDFRIAGRTTRVLPSKCLAALRNKDCPECGVIGGDGVPEYEPRGVL
jgi:hypothetical protein